MNCNNVLVLGSNEWPWPTHYDEGIPVLTIPQTHFNQKMPASDRPHRPDRPKCLLFRRFLRTVSDGTNSNNRGTARLHEQRKEKLRQTQMSAEQRELQRRIAIELNLARYFAKYRRSNGPDWTAKEVALLGTDVDRVIATKVGRSVEAVNRKRKKLEIPRIPDRLGGTSPWKEREIRLLGTDDDRVIAAKLDRTTVAVRMKRKKLGISRKGDHRRRD